MEEGNSGGIIDMEFLVHSFGISFILGLLLALWFKRREKTKSVCIVVLGDIGRSPRMQYHATSFTREGYAVEIVGYPGSPPLQELQDHANVKIHYLRNPPNLNNQLTRLLSYAVKVVWQSLNLSYVLFFKCNSSFLLIQNPPAIPTIPVCWFYCYARRVEFAIDWHNYAHTIMALSLGQNHRLVKLATFIESFFGAKARHNFCVTKAMQEDLEKKWKIQAKVLYDRPPEEFHPISIEEKHELLLKLSKDYDIFKGTEENCTAFTTQLPNGEVALRNDRPALVVSSTSWTEDEDFSILLDALSDYETECETSKNIKFPDLICVITGKGPLKDFYKAIIEKKNWKHVTIITPWLETEDYPKLLASADLGVCLHTSSSGLDLPMKVVDMFGCGLPVCAYNFKCLPELVRHNENSLVFSDCEALTKQLKSWFTNFPNDVGQQQRNSRFKYELTMFQQLRWHAKKNVVVNERPIIGILSQEISYKLNEVYPGMYDSYIAASYVKYIESAGARVVPIWIGQPVSYYKDILGKINGVLFPGGSTYFNQSNGYADAGAVIYKIAKKFNKQGDFFPIWGTCLGFELLTYVAANKFEHRSDCSSHNQALPLEFTSDFRDSRLFGKAPSDVIQILRSENVTGNYHRYCVTQEGLAKANLTNKFRVMSVNHDWNGQEFISTLEHVSMPFYGVQFHPEKNAYEWVKGKNIPHSFNAVRTNQYFADFFVNEARKNHHAFPSAGEENAALIYNYPATFTGMKGSSYLQCYMFKVNA
ncbi:chitobiosyldiphosphodolichol beta-mannosyltransferase isoform X2 [Nasonia vitripennis]|uniref:folate gamma-glutamyl hydrolase n=1 Tax=Nasonia vitripennis TaxID=7425 RepID=A0A7M7HGC9_NASVI|nr:chitobiosyldiphosphodolichol beta-mannosyltransferase isoform X2 [Nasonia vitripennis]